MTTLGEIDLDPALRLWLSQEWDGMPFDLLLETTGHSDQTAVDVGKALERLWQDAVENETLMDFTPSVWGPVAFEDGVWMHIEGCLEPPRAVDIVRRTLERQGLSGRLAMTYKREHTY